MCTSCILTLKNENIGFALDICSCIVESPLRIVGECFSTKGAKDTFDGSGQDKSP